MQLHDKEIVANSDQLKFIQNQSGTSSVKGENCQLPGKINDYPIGKL